MITGAKRKFRLPHIKAQTQTQIKWTLRCDSSHRTETISFPGNSQQAEYRNGVKKRKTCQPCSELSGDITAGKTQLDLWGDHSNGDEKGAAVHATTLAWVSIAKRVRRVKVSSSVPHRRQVIYRKQQNVQTRGFLKTPNSSIPSLCHLKPFTDLSAPMDSISPFQRNGELLDGSRLRVMHHLSRRIKMS